MARSTAVKRIFRRSSGTLKMVNNFSTGDRLLYRLVPLGIISARPCSVNRGSRWKRLTRLPIAIWSFSNGLPEKLQGPGLNAKSNEIAIETLEIAHEGL